ncbi:hypothetical protein AB3F25_07860 [Aggregatibacter sp. HMT-949]|uniref:hypothetical protein n=1 Tax=Aggregatibacter sp. HMT-949 TaxID=3235088 RepID=UPI00359C8589
MSYEFYFLAFNDFLLFIYIEFRSMSDLLFTALRLHFVPLAKPTFKILRILSLLVQSKSRQKESTPCFALFPEKLGICLTEIFELATLKHAKISYKFPIFQAAKKGTRFILSTI